MDLKIYSTQICNTKKSKPKKRAARNNLLKHAHEQCGNFYFTSGKPAPVTSNDRKVLVQSSLTKTSHLSKSIQYLFHVKNISNELTTIKMWLQKREDAPHLLWDCSFCRSIATSESRWCTRIGTVLPKLTWNSLPRTAWSSFCSSLIRLLKGMSTSTTWSSFTAAATLFRKGAISFLDEAGIYTKAPKIKILNKNLAYQDWSEEQIVNQISDKNRT